MGECPTWYPLLRAARYMGVPAWELERRPSYWRDRALTAEQAEASAQAQIMKHQTSKK